MSRRSSSPAGDNPAKANRSTLTVTAVPVDLVDPVEDADGRR
ncbi:hypothetical protein ACQYWQ_06270 [Streptomyces sp. P6-2-1]